MTMTTKEVSVEMLLFSKGRLFLLLCLLIRISFGLANTIIWSLESFHNGVTVSDSICNYGFPYLL